jgi:predicted chitinase
MNSYAALIDSSMGKSDDGPTRQEGKRAKKKSLLNAFKGGNTFESMENENPNLIWTEQVVSYIDQDLICAVPSNSLICPSLQRAAMTSPHFAATSKATPSAPTKKAQTKVEEDSSFDEVVVDTILDVSADLANLSVDQVCPDLSPIKQKNSPVRQGSPNNIQAISNFGVALNGPGSTNDQYADFATLIREIQQPFITAGGHSPARRLDFDDENPKKVIIQDHMNTVRFFSRSIEEREQLRSFEDSPHRSRNQDFGSAVSVMVAEQLKQLKEAGYTLREDVVAWADDLAQWAHEEKLADRMEGASLKIQETIQKQLTETSSALHETIAAIAANASVVEENNFFNPGEQGIIQTTTEDAVSYSSTRTAPTSNSTKSTDDVAYAAPVAFSFEDTSASSFSLPISSAAFKETWVSKSSEIKATLEESSLKLRQTFEESTLRLKASLEESSQKLKATFEEKSEQLKESFKSLDTVCSSPSGGVLNEDERPMQNPSAVSVTFSPHDLVPEEYSPPMQVVDNPINPQPAEVHLVDHLEHTNVISISHSQFGISPNHQQLSANLSFDSIEPLERSFTDPLDYGTNFTEKDFLECPPSPSAAAALSTEVLLKPNGKILLADEGSDLLRCQTMKSSSVGLDRKRHVVRAARRWSKAVKQQSPEKSPPTAFSPYDENKKQSTPSPVKLPILDHHSPSKSVSPNLVSAPSPSPTKRSFLRRSPSPEEKASAFRKAADVSFSTFPC